MTNQDVINFLNQVRKMLLDDKSWLESTIQPINEAFDKSISALQAQDSSVDLFPDLTIVEKAEIRGYVKGQLDAINDLVAAGLIEREKAISILKDHDLDEAGKDTISRQAAIDAINALHEEPNAWLDYAVDAVMTLPSAQPEPQWIPVSEGLPEDCTEVFVYLFESPSPYIAWVEDTRWNTEDFEVDMEDEPIAWMPLPKPWRGEKNDTD